MQKNEVYKAVVNITMPFSVQARNVYHAVYTLPQGDDQDAIRSFDMYLDQLYATIPDVVSSLVSFDSFDLYQAGECGKIPLEQQPHIGSAPIAIKGHRLDNMLPNQIAMLVTGLLTGRGKPAKKFLPGITEDLQSEGQVVSSVLTALANFARAWIMPFGVETGSEWVPVIYTRTGQCRNFVGFAIRDMLSTQRRRKPGVGI